MNLYGYDRGEAGDELETPRELSEVSVVADDPAELRRIAQFFAEAASIVESGRNIDHLHYQFWTDSWSHESGDLIVIQPRSQDGSECRSADSA